MNTRGFTLVELLVAMTIILLIASALMQAVPAAREAFSRIPAELDTQQRARMAIHAITQAVRASIAPIDGDANTLTVIVGAAGGGQAIVAGHSGTTAPIVLSASGCPALKDLCGFTAGALAVVGDGAGAFDLFSVAGLSVAARTLVPDHALSQMYPPGTAVAAADEYTFELARQADGSESLVRVTAAGAVQPIVDFVSDLAFVFDDAALQVAIRVHPESGQSVPSRVYRAAVKARE